MGYQLKKLKYCRQYQEKWDFSKYQWHKAKFLKIGISLKYYMMNTCKIIYFCARAKDQIWNRNIHKVQNRTKLMHFQLLLQNSKYINKMKTSQKIYSSDFINWWVLSVKLGISIMKILMDHLLKLGPWILSIWMSILFMEIKNVNWLSLLLKKV